MAYNYTKKYNFQAYDRAGSLHTVEIFGVNYSGSSTELTGYGNDPLYFSYPGSVEDPLYPIMGGELVLHVYAETEGQFREFAEARSRDWYCKYARELSHVWSGWLALDGQEEEWFDTPYVVTLRFSDHLGSLREYPYLQSDGSIYTGTVTALVVIAQCLEKLDIQDKDYIDVYDNMFDTGHSTINTVAPLDRVGIWQDGFLDEDLEPWSCYDVLWHILRSKGLKLFQYDEWKIVRVIEQYYNINNDMRYVRYTAAGVYSANGTIASGDWTKTITKGKGVALTSRYAWIERSQLLRINKPLREVNVKQEYGVRNRIKLGAFETTDWATYWNTHGASAPARITKSDASFCVQLSAGDYASWSSTDAGVDYAETIQVESGWQGIIKFKFRVDWTGSPTAIRANFVVWFDADSGAGNDLWLADGALGWVTSWYAVGVYADINNSGKWIEVELVSASGGITEAGVLKIYCNKAIRTGGTAVTNTYYTDIEVIRADDSDVVLDREEALSLTLTDNGINSMEEETIKLGDPQVNAAFESEWEQNAYNNITGAAVVPTSWQALVGSARTAFGVSQGLIEHFRDWMARFNARPMHKFIGRMSAGWIYPYYGFLTADNEDPYGNDRLFVIGTMSINVIECKVDLELLEVPRSPVPYGVEHSDDWTNDDFTTFTETAGVIDLTGGSADEANCDDDITVVAGERLDVMIRFVSGSGTLRLDIGGVTSDFSTEGRFQMAMATAGAKAIALIAQGVVSYNDLEIEIFRTAGY